MRSFQTKESGRQVVGPTLCGRTIRGIIVVVLFAGASFALVGVVEGARLVRPLRL